MPITTCTDLLKTGGYGRLPPYMHDLQKEMQKVGARTINDFILDYRGQRAAAGGDPVQAALLNTPIVVAETQADPRYQRRAKSRRYRKKSTRISSRSIASPAINAFPFARTMPTSLTTPVNCG